MAGSGLIWSAMSESTHTPATQPARHHFNVLGQMLKFIPRCIIDQTGHKGTDTLFRNRALSILRRDEIQRIVHETARSLLLVSSFR
jgi:hypothetical protein